MLDLSFWFYDSSLHLPSLSVVPSPHISLSFSLPLSQSPDGGQTEHFGETQLFYRWDQRQIVCASSSCVLVILKTCIYDAVLAGLQLFKGLVQVYARFRIKV